MGLQDDIAAANKRASLERQKGFAKKSHLAANAALRTETICARGDELIALLAGQCFGVEVKSAIDGLRQAIRIDRRERGSGR